MHNAKMKEAKNISNGHLVNFLKIRDKPSVKMLQAGQEKVKCSNDDKLSPMVLQTLSL